jgi:formyl-CoA transferase
MPLTGIKVIELGQNLAGPLAGAIMADLGANVIKVEKPNGGDDARRWGPPFSRDMAVSFQTWNRGKRSVTVDLKDPGEVVRLMTVIKDADILIQNLRPGVVEQVGLGPAAVTKANPRLIYCSISGYGHKGRQRLKPAYDPLLQAVGAIMTMTGTEDMPPLFQGTAIMDKGAGMWTVIAALAGLQQRQSTGKGCVIDTSLFETAVSWVDSSLANHLATGKLPTRHGAASALHVPYQAFDTKSQPIVVAAGNDRLFAKAAAEMGHPEWAGDPRFADIEARQSNRDVLLSMIREVLLEDSCEAWIERFERVGVPCAPINNLAQLAAEPQTEALEMLQDLPDTGVRTTAIPVSFNGVRPKAQRAPPALGAHNDEVFADAALTDGDD